MLSRHRCEQCGACCRWSGHVFLYRDDVRRLANRLDLSIPIFLNQYCVVVKWMAHGRGQYRIGLARDIAGTGCVFLKDSRCSVHDFKPLMCKAGPAGWPWIADPKSFWMYAERSPSFDHDEGSLSVDAADRWFARTRRAELTARKATSLAALAAVYGLPLRLVRSLRIVGFEKGDFDVGVPEKSSIS